MCASLGILSVAGPVQPVSLSSLVLDAKIIPDCVRLGITRPPLAEYALGSIGSLHAPPDASPSERRRRMIGKQRDGLDRLRMREETRRPRPPPCLGNLAIRRQRKNPFDGSLRNIALYRGDPVKPVSPDAVREDIHQVGDIAHSRLHQRRDRLFRCGRLRLSGRQSHDLDTEARCDLPHLVGKHPDEARAIPCRHSGPYPERLLHGINAMVYEVEPACAQASLLEALVNEAPVVVQWTAEQDLGKYFVTVRGVPGAYFVEALDREDDGVYSDLTVAINTAVRDYGEFFTGDV